MSLRPIVTCLDPILREKSAPVEHVDSDLDKLIEDMLETMYDAPGIGLAAIQIGLPRQLLVADISDDDAVRSPHVLINPKVVWTSDERNVYNEGCLSVPEHYAEVERPAACKVTFINRDGKEDSIDADGLLATCLQHEIDHLNGVLFIDYLSKLKRDMIIRKVAKANRDTEMV
ncbi:peptide deformylase [Iodidimonas gelatinilytica]|uniref:Peptide deformylase n=1 Tax=Iodidimonas gelatinilytica TaxID=1236966 RepID=A0A5A7MNW3_9PROT|nr:peptide deformylase [Iodidimonas gelatinilytica]GEQ97546.1 peptide deformylase [Iodidimonas gelatinilytica]GER01550.1 peptide deformylase [Iodidimonas gelatinilytica]